MVRIQNKHLEDTRMKKHSGLYSAVSILLVIVLVAGISLSLLPPVGQGRRIPSALSRIGSRQSRCKAPAALADKAPARIIQRIRILPRTHQSRRSPMSHRTRMTRRNPMTPSRIHRAPQTPRITPARATRAAPSQTITKAAPRIPVTMVMAPAETTGTTAAAEVTTAAAVRRMIPPAFIRH